MSNMELEKIKEEMKKYRDFYGGELLFHNEIDECKSIIECDNFIEKHRSHMEDMLSDASRHLDKFKQRVGISCYQ